MKYKLYDGAPLCFPCRRLEPYAYITKTQARKFFKFGKLAVERPEHPLHFANISYGNTPGTIYRFGDMVQLAELAVGPIAAAEQADKARAALGIGKMKGGAAQGRVKHDMLSVRGTSSMRLYASQEKVEHQKGTYSEMQTII